MIIKFEIFFALTKIDKNMIFTLKYEVFNTVLQTNNLEQKKEYVGEKINGIFLITLRKTVTHF